jgi:hypothetical protein
MIEHRGGKNGCRSTELERRGLDAYRSYFRTNYGEGDKRVLTNRKAGISVTAKQELEKFLAKFEPGIVRQAKKALGKMRKMVPGAVEMVYDNYNALAIGFGPSEKTSLAVFSIAVFPRHVSLFFLQGAGLHDPNKRFQGEGKVVRHVKLIPLTVLDDPEIRDLIELAKDCARVKIDGKQKRKLVIKSVSKKQRPRRAAGDRPGK